MPLSLPVIGAIGQGIEGLISGGLGISELVKANKMEKQNVRPTEQIPSAVTRATQLAQWLANMGLPNAQLEQGKQEIARGTNTALGAAQDRRGGLMALPGILQSMNDANLGLVTQGAQQRVSNIQNLQGQLGVLGEWQDKIWDWNSKQLYLENAAAIRAMRGAGWANVGNAFNSILGGGANLAASGTGGNTTPATTTQADPTITNADMFPSGVPSTYSDYLRTRAMYNNQPYRQAA